MKTVFTLTAAAAIALMGTLAVQAEVMNEAVKPRIEAMKTIGGAMKVVGEMAQGKTEFDADAAKAALDTMATTAATIPDVFKAEEMDPESHAKAEIWTNWDDFVADAEALQKAAEAADPSSPETLGASMRDLGGACQACHKEFRSSMS